MIAEVGGASEEYSTSLSSQGIQQREDTRMVDHQDNNPAQRDIISVIKMEISVFPWTSRITSADCLERLKENIFPGNLTTYCKKSLI